MDETRLIFPFSLKEREIEMKKRVYTLYRVSTKGQVEKDDIPMQKEACRNFAESQGWEIVKEFSEKGVSGFKKSAKERDELQKIQQAAMEGKFDILLVFMFDRLGRRDDETPFIVEWFTKQGIEVWSVNEGQQRFDTHVDKLMNYIRYWQASGESLKTSVRTRTRLEQLTGEGHYTGGTVPYGYKRVRLGRVNKKNQEVCDLVIDEAEAEIVRLIFHKYVYEGYGAQKLSHYLYEQGVVGRNNKNIPNTSIVRMIKNKGYTGYLINGAVETECPQLRIIEPELFEQAQELRQARTCERGGTSLGTSSKALLTGLVYCGHCGNRLSLTSSGRTHTYADGHTVKEVRPRYSCFYKIRHPGDCDGQSGYGVSKLDSIVEEVVRQIFAQFREVSRKKLLESVKTNDAARIQKKIQKIQKDLEAKHEVIGRGQPPAAFRIEEEGKVLGMVVLIAEPDVERHEPDQLFHVLGIAGEGFSQPEQVFVVEGGVPVRGVQQPAGGMHMHLAAVLAVEAPDPEVGGPVPAGEEGCVRHLDPRPLRGEGTGVFHPADGGIVMARRELDQPRIAAGLGDGVGHDEPPVAGHPDHDLGPRPAGGAVQGHECAQRLHGQRVLIEGAPRLFGHAVQIDAFGQRFGVRGHGLIFQRAHAAAPHQREPG